MLLIDALSNALHCAIACKLYFIAVSGTGCKVQNITDMCTALVDPVRAHSICTFWLDATAALKIVNTAAIMAINHRNLLKGGQTSSASDVHEQTKLQRLKAAIFQWHAGDEMPQ